VRLVHFPLHPETPMEGRTLEELFAGRDYDIDASYRRMKALMDAEGLPYEKRTHTYNSRLAQEIGAWAEAEHPDEADAVHDGFYRAYFVDRRNIAEDDVILDVVTGAGLSADDAKRVLVDRSYKEAVDADWNKARQYGVTGVPTYVCNGYGVVGAQPYETLEKFMEQLGVPKIRE
jgi:predicted DsbA family dithiol-disulfide isomerase